MFNFGFCVTFANFGRILSKHGTVPDVLLWAFWMLSYHQDAVNRSMGGLILSQMVAITALIGLAIFGGTDREWRNFILLRFWVASPRVYETLVGAARCVAVMSLPCEAR